MNNRLLFTAALGCLLTTTAYADSGVWSSGWAMGTSEYAVDDGNGNELVIACPNDEARYISARATIQGHGYSSESEQGFDVIVDGKSFSNPFNTDCRACSNIFKHEFWQALRNASRLQLSAQGRTINLPTSNLKAVLPALDAEESSCQAAW